MYARQSLHLTIGSFLNETAGTSSPFDKNKKLVFGKYFYL
jgi:hypothetical protein